MRIYINEAEERIRQVSALSYIDIQSIVEALTTRQDLSIQLVTWYNNRIIIYTYIMGKYKPQGYPPPHKHCDIIAHLSPFTTHEVRNGFRYLHMMVIFPDTHDVNIMTLDDGNPATLIDKVFEGTTNE